MEYSMECNMECIYMDLLVTLSVRGFLKVFLMVFIRSLPQWGSGIHLPYIRNTFPFRSQITKDTYQALVTTFQVPSQIFYNTPATTGHPIMGATTGTSLATQMRTLKDTDRSCPTRFLHMITPTEKNSLGFIIPETREKSILGMIMDMTLNSGQNLTILKAVANFLEAVVNIQKAAVNILEVVVSILEAVDRNILATMGTAVLCLQDIMYQSRDSKLSSGH